MKNPDRLLGTVTLAVGVAVLGSIQRFPHGDPNLPGPGFFPGLLGACFVLCGVMLWFGPRAAVEPDKPLGVTRLGLRRAADVVGCVVFYILVAESLGFLVTGSALTLYLLLRLGNSWRLALAVALPLVFVTFLLFNNLFLVQLPRTFW